MGLKGKKVKIPPEVLARIGPPPIDFPLKMARWWLKLVAEAAWLYAQGLMPAEHLDKLRAVSASAAKILPEDLRFEAERRLKEDEDSRTVESDGPELDDVSSISLRG